tara:strand:+ start:1195 stop:2661 length:1467 start_codon:yes stop_codon:yes gene_type:complete
MKNYLKNIKKYDFAEKFKFFVDKIKAVNVKSFKTIIVVYTVIFSVFLFLSIPGLYNYKNYLKKIETAALLDFKIRLDNIVDVKYRFVPKPHILIGEATVSFDKVGSKEFANLKNIKIYISLIDLYKKNEISIKSLSVSKANFYFGKNTFSNFREHLNKAIIKPIKVSNSNFFYLAKNEEVASISPIKELNYFIDYKLKEKNLKIKGKLFDVNYNFNWKKNYNDPNKIKSHISFANPNISLSNISNKNFQNSFNDGKLKTIFLNNKIDINYKVFKDKINFITENNNLDSNYKIKFNGSIDLNPFYFNAKADLFNLDYVILIDKILPYLYIYRESIHPNINGNFKINFISEKNKLIENISANLTFNNEKIIVNESSVDIKKIGNLIVSDLKYTNKDEKIYIKSKMQLNIDDQKQFYYRFQIPKKNRISIEKIDFHLEKNLDEKKYYISNIKINSMNDDLNSSKINLFDDHEINNIQTLTKLINDYLEAIN